MEIDFHFTPTREDYVKGSQVVFSPSPWSIVIMTLVAGGIAVVYGNDAVNRIDPATRSDWYMPFVVLLIILLVTVAAFFLPAFLFSTAIDTKLKSIKEASLPVTWHIDETGIVTKTELSEIELAWSVYSRAIEYGAYYMLLSRKSKLSCSVIPKRAFESEQEEKDFRALVEQQLGPIEDETYARRTLPLRLHLGGLALLAIVVVGYWIALYSAMVR